MNTVASIPPDTIWQWCVEYYSDAGRKLQLPANTAKEKTYQWRYMMILAKKFEKWQFSHSLARKFIAVAVEHGAARGLLNKGLALFHQNNLLEVCYKKLCQHANSLSAAMDEVRKTRAWLIGLAGSNEPKKLVKLLMKSESLGELPNIVRWYRNGKIGQTFLAFSRACAAAMLGLKEKHRAYLPTDQQLALARISLMHGKLSGALDRATFRAIFDTDWRS